MYDLNWIPFTQSLHPLNTNYCKLSQTNSLGDIGGFAYNKQFPICPFISTYIYFVIVTSNRVRMFLHSMKISAWQIWRNMIERQGTFYLPKVCTLWILTIANYHKQIHWGILGALLITNNFQFAHSFLHISILSLWLLIVSVCFCIPWRSRHDKFDETWSSVKGHFIYPKFAPFEY